MLQTHNSQSSFSKRYSCLMQENSEQEWRKQRLSELAKSKGGNASLGRLLGYRDGAYVGQMIGGLRPVTEKLVEKIHQMHGLHTWFKRGTDQQNTDSANHWGGRTQEPQRLYVAEPPPAYGWPFKSVTIAEWESIPSHKREVIEEQVRGMVCSEQAGKRAA